MMKKKRKGNLSKLGMTLALVSAFLSALVVIIEKRYIDFLSEEAILFLMYLGSGVGLFIIHMITKKTKEDKSNKITKAEIPKILVIIICELFASLLIIKSLKIVTASLVSLLLVFEIIMTSFFAYIMFDEKIKRNEIISIILIVLGFVILNFDKSAFNGVNIGSLLVVGACLCWGIANNVTGLISSKEPAFFTSIKCLSVAGLYFIICMIHNSLSLSFPFLLLFGFLTSGLSILTYALSTKYLGANKATLIFSFNPIFGVILSVLIYKEQVTGLFFISFVLMIIAIICLNRGDNS